jgi:HTH-type transcriptional regulator/antitoxin HigA
MASQVRNQYSPDSVSLPGDTLLETLETIGMTQAELAERTGRTKKTINEIIQGKAPITPDTALQLERVLGVPARFWNNRERHYREYLARAEERERLQESIEWLDQVPVAAMCKMHWIERRQDKVEQLREVLNFFGVASPKQWARVWLDSRAAFRQSPAFEADPGAIAAWLRMGEIQAQFISCAPYDDDCFRAKLKQIRSLTLEPSEVFQPELVRLGARCGVAVVFVPELPKIRTWGTTYWLTPVKALIQLSLRYRSDDHLWFTFFHEAGHILLHGKRDVFIEASESEERDEKEEEADKFAADWLISPSDWRRIAGCVRYSKDMIREFAAELGIAPGIVVGRLQHDGYLPPSHCNELKRRFEWVQSKG